MGVSFSHGGGVVLPLAGVPSPRHALQSRQSDSTPPPPPCSSSADSGDASSPAVASARVNALGSNQLNPNTLAQQIQLSLKALSLDWAIVDREIDLITMRFAAALLTSRLRIPRVVSRSGEGDDTMLSGSVNAQQRTLLEYVRDAPSDLDATSSLSLSTSASALVDNEDDVGPQELYVSAALRLAALQLGRDGLQRITVALAFLASGGESREERRLRRNASLNTNNAVRHSESSLQEINHYQRGAGFTGSTSAAAVVGSSNSVALHPAANTFNASGSTLHSLASSGSTLTGRRFSTAPHPQAPAQTPTATGSNKVAQTSSASADHLTHNTSLHNNSCLPPALRPPTSARSSGGDEAAYLPGASSLYNRHCSISPLVGAAGNGSAFTANYFLRARPAAEVEFSTKEHSYNNMLLTSMNARSTVVSPLRTGLHGELLYSNSSCTTLMSLSTNAGAHTGRSHRGGAGGVADHHNSALRSPVSPYFHSTTQWVIPPAPLGAQVTSTGGVISANSSIPNSLSSMASPPSAPDPRRRSASYLRRLIQPLSPYQISRLSAVGAAGVDTLLRPSSGEANLNTLVYQLPQAVGGGGAELIGLEGCTSSCDGNWGSGNGGLAAGAGVPPLAPEPRDSALQFLRPEAVLTALCSVFAHLHLSTDDVTNLVTLLVVAALEVQTDAQLRRLVETNEEVPPESLQTPSMKQIRAAVRDSLTVLLTPMYTKTRLTLCAAAGTAEGDIQAAFLACSASVCGTSGNSSAGNNNQQQQQQRTPLKPNNVPAPDFSASHAAPPPTVPPSGLSSSGDRNLSVPVSHFSVTPPCRIAAATADDAEPNSSGQSNTAAEVDLAPHVRAVHEFFRANIPMESMPSAWGANGSSSSATAARTTAARRLSSTQRSSGSRQQQPPTHQAITTKAAAVATYAHSSYSDSAAGPTSSGSMSHSDITDGVANFTGGLPGRNGEASVTAPTQDEVRCASSFLMDMETAFVLHYAELITQGATADKRKSTTTTTPSSASSPMPPSPLLSSSKRLRQRTSSINKRSTLPSPSSPPAAAPTSLFSGKSYPWRRRSDADPDLFVQFSSNSTVWPLRTRLLVRRYEYAYVYDAMASTMALLHEESLYAGEGTAASASDTAASTSRVPHPHTPIALIDLNKATIDKNASDLQVLSGPGDVEVVSLMPSRVTRNSLVHLHEKRSGATATSPSRCSTPNSSSFSNSPNDSVHTPRVGTTAATTSSPHRNSHPPSNVDELLNYCWADAYQKDTEVYRMKGSTGTMYLLTVPAEADRVMVSIAAANSLHRSPQGGSAAGSASAANPAEDVIQASVIRSFERNRLVRPAVLSLASSATTATGGMMKDAGQCSSGNTTASSRLAGSGKGSRVQCTYNDGNGEVLSLELGSEPTRIAAYPLRLIYRGVLHHFFFPNPSARDHWYQQLLQLSWMMQSRRYLELVAAAPQDVKCFMRNRISFPTGPGAFECLDMLGAGTFGRVLLVQHKLSKRLFAMKVIRKCGFHGIRNIIEARREKKILDQLDCPYIMKIHSSFQTDSRVYLLFDYLPGAELLLHTQSAHSNHFDEATSRFYIAELAIAVEYLRVRGIVHRDIKGDNLVLDTEGHVVLTDFGFAKNIMSRSLSDPSALPQVVRQHTSCGTLAYIAPEVLCNSRRRSGYGLAVDWWSLGVVLFTFLTGYFPFLKQTGPETSQAIVSSPLQFPPRPALSEDARSLLEQLLQKDPEKRITCLADLRHHRFFKGFDWTACCERRLPPPLVLHKDSYRSPRTTADARQLLQDRVRRSLAWSSGQTDVPYVAPSHSRRSASDKLSLKHQPHLAEEQAELKLVEQAYGSDCIPKPLSACNDVFSPLFEQQERCGSDRDESDVEDLQMDDYVADLSQATLGALKRLMDSNASQELCSSFSDISLSSGTNEQHHDRVGGSAVASGSSRHVKVVGLPTLPVLVNFSEDMYCDVALAKYNPS